MKICKAICTASLVTVLATCLQGCDSDDGMSAPMVRINVESCSATRMAYADENNFILTTWSEDDALRIIPSNGKASQVFKLITGEGTRLGTFQGAAPEVEDSTFTVLYPASLSTVADFDAFSYKGQVQDGDSSMTGVVAFHTVKLVSTTPDFTAFSFSNAVQSSLIVMSLNNLPSSIGVPTQVTLTADEACFAVTNSTVDKEIALQFKNMKQTTKITAYLMLGVNSDNAKLTAGKTMTVTVAGDKGSCHHTFTFKSDAVFTGGNRHNINVNTWSI
jgi:hypothetical protein